MDQTDDEAHREQANGQLHEQLQQDEPAEHVDKEEEDRTERLSNEAVSFSGQVALMYNDSNARTHAARTLAFAGGADKDAPQAVSMASIFFQFAQYFS